MEGMAIVGYADRLSAQPGDAVRVMVSTGASSFRTEIVRLLHGIDALDGSGFEAEPVPGGDLGELPGREQPLRLGSFVDVPPSPRLQELAGFGFAAWIWPTTPDRGLQPLISCVDGDGAGFAVALDEGCLAVRLGGETVRLTDVPLEARQWYFICAGYDGETGQLSARVAPRERWPGRDVQHGEAGTAAAAQVGAAAPLRLAALGAGGAWPAQLYNGKLEAPLLTARPLTVAEAEALQAGGEPPSGVVARWDLRTTIGSFAVPDRSGNGLDGTTVNMPMQAVTGHNWTGVHDDFTRVPDEYAAMHFHDTDLDDARWEESFSYEIPADLPSGIYAAHVQCEDGEDHIPFVVRPPRGTATQRVAFLAPTFSYMAYANEQLGNRPEIAELLAVYDQAEFAAKYPYQDFDRYIVASGLRSCYDFHSDRSGVCYGSHLRPLSTLRPRYLMPLLGPQGSPHQLNADLQILSWMRWLGVEFDVITDHDLHFEGLELVKPYDVIVTGSHPEYCSGGMIDSLKAYLGGGGRMMYMGGNGFFWVTTLDHRGQVLETRRARGMRPWDSEPGQECHSTTGELGGMWRYRNRVPQTWLGVGFTSQGNDPGVPYERMPDSRDPELSWMFEGVEGDLIGDHPNTVLGYGAAGFETDRADARLGTPSHTAVVARAIVPDTYHHAIEEVDAGYVLEPTRADMTYLTYPNGGAVWSVGSITYAGALSYDGYDNNVARLTSNVLRRFLAR